MTENSAAALECLQAYGLSGNVREHENAIERAAVLEAAAQMLREDLPEDTFEASVGPATRAAPASFHAAVLETKKTAIARALEAAKCSYMEAARALGVHPHYLHRLARNLGLRRDS